MTQAFSAADLFRRVAPEVAARFAFRMHPNVAAEREAEIADAMGVNRPRLRPVGYTSPMTRAALSSIEKRRAMAQARWDRVRELHAQGMSASQIGLALGVTNETARKDLREMGLKPHYPRFNRMNMSLRRQRAIRFCRENPEATNKEICHRFDVSEYTARTYRREARQ